MHMYTASYSYLHALLWFHIHSLFGHGMIDNVSSHRPMSLNQSIIFCPNCDSPFLATYSSLSSLCSSPSPSPSNPNFATPTQTTKATTSETTTKTTTSLKALPNTVKSSDPWISSDDETPLAPQHHPISSHKSTNKKTSRKNIHNPPSHSLIDNNSDEELLYQPTKQSLAQCHKKRKNTSSQHQKAKRKRSKSATLSTNHNSSKQAVTKVNSKQ